MFYFESTKPSLLSCGCVSAGTYCIFIDTRTTDSSKCFWEQRRLLITVNAMCSRQASRTICSAHGTQAGHGKLTGDQLAVLFAPAIFTLKCLAICLTSEARTACGCRSIREKSSSEFCCYRRRQLTNESIANILNWRNSPFFLRGVEANSIVQFSFEKRIVCQPGVLPR